MKCRHIIAGVLISFTFSPDLNAQQDSIPFKSDISVFIKGHPGEKYIARELLTGNFEISASDTTFSIVRAQLCWDFTDGIICILIRGNRVNFDTLITKGSYQPPQLHSMLTIDNIQLKKDGKTCKASSMVYNLVPESELAAVYDTLAKTAAYIPSYQHQFQLPRSVFINGFTLALEDTTYEVLSFIISFHYHDKDEPVSFYCDGKSLLPVMTGYNQALSRLIYKDEITLENIYARKNGKTYRVPDIWFTLQR